MNFYISLNLKKENIKLNLLLIFFFLASSLTGQDANSYKNNFWSLPTGSRISYYFFEGKQPSKKTPIIYLHGGPGGYITKKNLEVFQQLSNDGYDVYLYDQVGGGKSERLENIMEYSVERHLSDLEAIVDTICHSKVIFIAHSWGASLAPLYLNKHPNRVEKMIFSGPGGIIPKNFNYKLNAPDSLNLSPIINNNKSRLDSKGYKRLFKIYHKALKGKKIATDNEIDSLLDCMIQKTTFNIGSDSVNIESYEIGAGGYSNCITAEFLSKGRDIRNDLKKNNIPILILLGENDNLPWACVDDYLVTFKNCKLEVIPQAGHMVFNYQPDLCLKLVRKFLN